MANYSQVIRSVVIPDTGMLYVKENIQAIMQVILDFYLLPVDRSAHVHISVALCPSVLLACTSS